MKANLSTLLLVLLTILLVASCKEKNEVQYNSELAELLEQMTEIDQYFAGIPQGKHEGNWERWYQLRDSVNRLHKKVLDSVLNRYGYPGYDLIGEAGESNFWVMVQHCDFDPDFQEAVLAQLKSQIAIKNANPSHFGLLTDRVRKNRGKPQLYGTQVDYNDKGQAYIKSLENRTEVNTRRKELGMELLEEYLNDMTSAHFEMNKEYLLKQGINAPQLYEIPKE